MTEETGKSESEREHRKRVLKGASIITTINDSEIACTVRNMHEHGAELRVPVEAHIPDKFMLHISLDNMTWNCERRWRMNERVGVKFLGQTRKPAWHYG